ncbi:MAG: recombination protein NinG [Bacteroidota bacterium]
MAYTPTINKCKFGDCSKCGAKDTDVVKLGKELVCLKCNKEIKVKKYTQKASLNQRVRSLGNKQVSEGNYFEAERQALINDLDYVHSRIVRMTAANKFGYANCFTCGKEQHWSMMQLSHFIKRANTLTRWDFRANRCCCKHCNETLDGNLEVFAYKLDEEQNGLSQQLQEIAREPYKWSREELKSLLIDLRAKLRLIESKFN